MPDTVSPQAVLQAITELRQWAAELGHVSGTLSDFAFKWAERNGGVPKTRAATDKLLAEYRSRFDPQPDVPDAQALQAMEERYQAWAKERGIETATPADVQRFDDETGLLTRRIDELSGFTGPKDLAHRIGARLDELSRIAVAMGCDDATVAALKGAAALAPDIAEGRAVLDYPATWTDARRQANAMFRSEAIAGIPLNRACEVALDRLEQAALSQAVASAEPKLSDDEPDAQANAKPAGVPGKGMTWREAMKAAEDHCARNPFPGVNALAKIVGCSTATIRKAIDHSTKLRAKAAEHEARRKSVSAGAMTERVAASAKQSRERDPSEAASTDEIFRALLEQAKEQERARLNAMNDAQRRELVAAMDEDSIRELFKPRTR